MILSGHVMPEVSAVCDRIVVLSRGRVIAAGTPTEIIAQCRPGNVGRGVRRVDRVGRRTELKMRSSWGGGRTDVPADFRHCSKELREAVRDWRSLLSGLFYGVWGPMVMALALTALARDRSDSPPTLIVEGGGSGPLMAFFEGSWSRLFRRLRVRPDPIGARCRSPCRRSRLSG